MAPVGPPHEVRRRAILCVHLDDLAVPCDAAAPSLITWEGTPAPSFRFRIHNIESYLGAGVAVGFRGEPEQGLQHREGDQLGVLDPPRSALLISADLEHPTSDPARNTPYRTRWNRSSRVASWVTAES